MNSNRNITQRIAQTMSHLFGLALFLLLVILILLLIPGMILLSILADQPGISLSTCQHWAGSFVASLSVYLLLLALIRNAKRAFILYGMICIASLITAMTVSSLYSHHFGQRWIHRFLGGLCILK